MGQSLVLYCQLQSNISIYFFKLVLFILFKVNDIKKYRDLLLYWYWYWSIYLSNDCVGYNKFFLSNTHLTTFGGQLISFHSSTLYSRIFKYENIFLLL
jgi:hypothetical protein